jgi:hypothetical protein
MLEKYIKKFSLYAIKEYSSDNLDYQNCKKCDVVMSGILAEVERYGLTKEFYSTLFDSSDPCVLRAIAAFSWQNNFNVYKTLEIFTYLTERQNIKFSSDERINKKWIANCKALIPSIKATIDLYERIKDAKLFRQYRNYLQAISQYMVNWLESKEKQSQESWQKAIAITDEVRVDGKLSRLFDLSFGEQDNSIKIANALVSADIGYDKEQSRRILGDLIVAGDKVLNPRMLQFCKERLKEIK